MINNITMYYDLFMQTLDEIIETITGCLIFMINGLRTPEEIHKEIMQKEGFIYFLMKKL